MIDASPRPAILPPDRVAFTTRQEDMRHPDSAFADAGYRHESLDQLRRDYLAWLRGRPRPTASGTVKKYDDSLRGLVRSIEHDGRRATLDDLTPASVAAWVQGQRTRGLSEFGIASRLSAIKAFTNRYLYREMEATTVDLLRKVQKLTPPDKPRRGLSEDEREKILACFDLPTFEDTRDRAIIAVFLATGLRYKEVIELSLGAIDRLRGDLTVMGKGDRIRQARLSPRALKYVRGYLNDRPRSDSDQLWLRADGQPLTYHGGMMIIRRVRHRSGVARVHFHLFRHGFAQVALTKGAHPGIVQEMLGHTTGAMTRKYLGWAKQEEAARQMPQYAPI